MSRHDEIDEYIPVEEVAARLKVSVRQASRYGNRVRTQRAGRRILYHREDVEQLADELGAEYRIDPPPARSDLLPPGEFLATIERLSSEVARLSREKGQLEGTLQAQAQQQRQLTDTTQTLMQQLEAAEAERDTFKQQLDRIRRRSWWRRLLDL